MIRFVLITNDTSHFYLWTMWKFHVINFYTQTLTFILIAKPAHLCSYQIIQLRDFNMSR